MAELGKRAVYVVGAAETPLGKVPDQTELSMVSLATREALGEAGLTFADVDGIFCHRMGEEGTVQVGEYLGVNPRYADSTDFGGAAFEAFVHHAMVAIATGRCEVALIVYASRQRSKRSRRTTGPEEGATLRNQFEAPQGLPFPIGHYALAAARHAHEHGTTPGQLAEVAVAARSWAQLNPKAWSRDPLSIEEVMESPLVCDPLRRLDCCLVTDGGGAIVLTHADRARDADKRPIRVIGAGEGQGTWLTSQMPDLTVSPGTISGREAFGMAGIVPGDVDVLEPYDSFTITVLLILEDLGFCAKGEAGSFVESGRLAPGGELPSMTSGGGLSYNHPGAFGLLLLVEAVRQLRGECGDRQVPDAQIAVAHGSGGLLSTASTVVLARD
jgi:acetyl-CoA acetyltransferase